MLFNINKVTKIHLLHKSVDFRKGLLGLNYILYEESYQEYNVGELFIFFSRNRKSLKILYYSVTGFELWYKKLSGFNRYKIPLDLGRNSILTLRVIVKFCVLEDLGGIFYLNRIIKILIIFINFFLINAINEFI